jgi:serine/threonine protein kinase
MIYHLASDAAPAVRSPKAHHGKRLHRTSSNASDASADHYADSDDASAVSDADTKQQQQQQQQHQQQQQQACVDDGSSGVGRGGESLMPGGGGEGGEVFEKVRLLGRGSFGTVSLVRHKETKKMFAVKVIKHGDTRDERHRAMQEVRLMQMLNHACVIKLSDAFISSDGRSLWYVLRTCCSICCTVACSLNVVLEVAVLAMHAASSINSAACFKALYANCLL